MQRKLHQKTYSNKWVKNCINHVKLEYYNQNVHLRRGRGRGKGILFIQNNVPNSKTHSSFACP